MNESDVSHHKPVGTREWYDFIGLLADGLPGVHLGGEDATSALLDMCHLNHTSWVLDVGCGPGVTACLIAEKYGSQVRGIDISEVMVAKAKDRVRKRGLQNQIAFRVANVFQLPYQNDSFNVVIIESVLTTLMGEVGKALAEIFRVVRPGGRVGANESTIDPSTPQELLALFAEHPAMHHCFTPQGLYTLFVKTGLEVIQMQETRNVEAPNVLKEMGAAGLVSFMIRVYPKILVKLLRDARFRQAASVDDKITKQSQEYMGYTLIVGQKPA